MTPMPSNTDTGPAERYGMVRTGADEVLIYDRNRSNVWILSEQAVALDSVA